MSVVPYASSGLWIGSVSFAPSATLRSKRTRARMHARTYARKCTCACTCAIYILHWLVHAIAVCPNSGARRVPQLARLHRLLLHNNQ